jgi:hypothetical protein
MAGDERRQQILHVAMRLFSKRGFSGTTTKEIAQRSGRFRSDGFSAFRQQRRALFGDSRPQSVQSQFQNPFDEVSAIKA